jgi:hypothetical protein
VVLRFLLPVVTISDTEFSHELSWH